MRLTKSIVALCAFAALASCKGSQYAITGGGTHREMSIAGTGQSVTGYRADLEMSNPDDVPGLVTTLGVSDSSGSFSLNGTPMSADALVGELGARYEIDRFKLWLLTPYVGGGLTAGEYGLEQNGVREAETALGGYGSVGLRIGDGPIFGKIEYRHNVGVEFDSTSVNGNGNQLLFGVGFTF